MNIKRILMGLGGTEYTPIAISHAVDLARLHGAEITGVTVLDESRLSSVGPVPLGGAHIAKTLREKRLAISRQRVLEAIEQFEQRCSDEGVTYRVQHESGEPFAMMTSLSRYHDLMIFGLRSLFDSGLGVDAEDTLMRLVRSGVRPMLAVPNEYRPIRSVLLAYSGSPESAKAIRHFMQSWLWPDCRLRLLTCGPDKKQSESLVAEMADYCRAQGYAPEIEISLSPPKVQILDSAAGFDADLIVMGNGVRSIWIDKILGGTALHVIQNAGRALYLAQ